MIQKLLFITVLCVAFVGSGTAQDFEVAPVELVFRVDPGQKQEKMVMITNHSSTVQQFQISKADFVTDIKGNRQTMEENSTENSCASWISYGDAFFELQPNESRSIPVSMEVPEGDYVTRWAMLHVQTTQARTSFDADYEKLAAGLLISGRIGIKVFRLPVNSPKPIVKIINLRERESDSGENRSFSVDIQNKGASIANCKITYVVLNLKTAEKISFPAGTVQVLPGTLREIYFELDESIPPGEYALSAILDFGDKNVLEGTRMQSKLVVE